MIPELYVENGVGKTLVKAINLYTPKHGVTARFQHEIHPGMQRAQKGDEWWIEDISKRGMAILTQDAAIFGVESERQAVLDGKGVIFAFGRGNYSGMNKLRIVLTHWDNISEWLEEDNGPRAARITLGDFREIDLSTGILI